MNREIYKNFRAAVLGLFFLCTILFMTSCEKPFNLEDSLRNIPGLKLEVVEKAEPYKTIFHIYLTQPLDHANPQGETFEQKIILSHLDRSKPMVMVTEGYSLGRNFIAELGLLLESNELRVEHRFFGKSLPAVKPGDTNKKWRYLNLKQACADYHRIVGLFKKIYDNNWVSTGWSKGGQTALTYRSLYPADVAATVAYDAPLNFALEDKRIDAFFDTVGSAACREKLIAFQRLALKNKKELLPLVKAYAQEEKLNFSIGLENALEYVVLEYTFSFWQYHKIDCNTIPGKDSTPEKMFRHLKTVVSFGSYADRSMNSAAMYQFCTQLGYYGYVRKNVQDLLSSETYANCAYAPQDTALGYDPAPMRKLDQWLQNKGKNILYIYGQLDPWSAPAVRLNGKTNAVKMVLKEGNHFTFINTFPQPQKKSMLKTLNQWIKRRASKQ